MLLDSDESANFIEDRGECDLAFFISLADPKFDFPVSTLL
jgi:hypothetical protein